MEYKYIKQRIAPCGLHCGKCFAFSDGDIVKNSAILKENLGQFDTYANRFVELLDEPKFKKYSDFKEMLQYFADAKCTGCRAEKCKIYNDCRVRECTVNRGVDFCFECKEFPCSNTGFDENLHKRSVEINTRIKEIGVTEYYSEIKDKPRY